MKSVYISQPITGLTADQVEAARREIIHRVDGKFGDCTYYVPGNSENAIRQADLIAFVKDWKNHEECQHDRRVAEYWKKELFED